MISLTAGGLGPKPLSGAATVRLKRAQLEAQAPHRPLLAVDREGVIRF